MLLVPAASGAQEPSGGRRGPPAWAYDASLAFYVVPDQTNLLASPS